MRYEMDDQTRGLQHIHDFSHFVIKSSDLQALDTSSMAQMFSAWASIGRKDPLENQGTLPNILAESQWHQMPTSSWITQADYMERKESLTYRDGGGGLRLFILFRYWWRGSANCTGFGISNQNTSKQLRCQRTTCFDEDKRTATQIDSIDFFLARFPHRNHNILLFQCWSSYDSRLPGLLLCQKLRGTCREIGI